MSIRKPTEEDLQSDWAMRLGAGLERGETVVPVLVGEKFVVAKFPGHSYWTGIGCPRSYAKTSYHIVAKGQNILSAPDLHEGRATARDMGRMQLVLEQAERTGSLPGR